MTSPVGRLLFGDKASQIVSERVAGYFATTTALTALAPKKRNNGMIAVVGQTQYVFQSDAVAGGLTPDSGTGRWIAAGEASQPVALVRVASAAALAANTRTGNVLTADANGALGTVDGATMVAGDKVLLKNESTGANNGIYVVTSLGGASSKFTFTRDPAMDASAEVLTGMLVVSSEGSVGANAIWMLTTNAPITINSTALTFGAVGTATASDATPAALGTAAAGVATSFSRADHVHANPVQAGVATLTSGTVTVSGVTLTSSSRILLSRKTQGGTVTNTVEYEAPSASRNTGASTFVINAVVAAGTTNTADTSVIDWLVYG